MIQASDNLDRQSNTLLAYSICNKWSYTLFYTIIVMGVRGEVYLLVALSLPIYLLIIEFMKEKKLETILDHTKTFNKIKLREICILLEVKIRDKDFRYTLIYDILEKAMQNEDNLNLIHDAVIRIIRQRHDDYIKKQLQDEFTR